MANRFRQFRLLLWKNFILQIRRPIGTVFELLLPVLLLSVLILPKKFIETKDFCFSTFEPLSSRDFKTKLVEELADDDKRKLFREMRSSNMTGAKFEALKELENKSYLAYYPASPLVANLMTRVRDIAGVKLAPRSIFRNGNWSSGDEMAEEASEHEEYLGAVDFAISKDATELPKQVKYSLRLPHEVGGGLKRWRTENTYPNFQAVGPRKEEEEGQCCPGYKSRFVLLQYAIDMGIILEHSNISQPIPLNLQQFPYPKFTQNFFIQTVEGLLPLLMTLAFMFSAVMIIKELVHEKHNRLKESMKMMGLANWIHWSAWFTKNLLFLAISIIIATALLKGMKIFEFSDGTLLFVFLLLYIIASIVFCFAISVFFSRPVVAMLFGLVAWYCSLVPYQTFSQQEVYEALTRSEKAAACLLPNTCLGIATRIIAKFESIEVGLTWDRVSTSPSPDDDFSFSWVLGMLVIQSLIFGLITWYIEAVFPGSYGIPRPFYFPFMKSYWCGTSRDNVLQVSAEEEMRPVEKTSDNPDIEDETHDLPVGVYMKDLRKVFKGSAGSKVAVDGLTLQMYKGQITALLGHNGAGKTTTMSILTGLFPPTSGSAHINGKSILTDMDAIRDSLGLCPQHNVLFDRLSVQEHLEFFVNLKGTFGPQAQTEVQQMINDIQLTDKMNWASSKLSGGMKRKLSCAIALIGGSQTVFLDEPTSGMDPYARRGTWDLLLKHKAGKTIILTTHFMDEADFLGDRIAIMADGQLRCCGSSLFLKGRYGVGYHLTLVKKENCNQNAVTSLIMSYVPNAQLLSSAGAELEFVLSSENSSGFESLFQEIENKMEEYGIASFGVSVTTLEEVFMKVGEGSEKTVDDLAHDHEVAGQDGEQIVNIAEVEQLQEGGLQTGLSLKWQQYKAMFMKRFLNSKRDKKAIITQLVLPIVMVLFGLLLITTVPTRDSDPPRVLKLSNLSVDGVHSKAFFADFRNASSAVKQETLEKTKTYLTSVKVDAQNITSKVQHIQDGNSGSSILVRDKTYSYSNGSTTCCNFEYFVLNAQCRDIFISQDLKPEKCKDYNFGYNDCPKCILANASNEKIDKDTTCSAVGCPGTELNNLNTYFSEYVLEQSNASDYFNVYVAGFLFAPEAPAMSMSPNKTNSSGKSPDNKEPETTTTVWYSNEGFHTIAEALSAMSNILLTDTVGDSSYGIEITNHPLPNSIKNKTDNVTADFSALLLAIFLALGMAYMAASFITFIVQERVSKAKHLQFVSGVDVFSYWFATYTWDFINYLVPALVILILFAAFQVESYENELGAVFLMLLLFGLCVLPFVYCLSFLFTTPLVAYALTVFVLSILSLAMLITVFVLQIPSVDAKDEAEICHYIFMLIPTYTLAYTFVDMNSNFGFRKVCSESEIIRMKCANDNITYTDHALDWERPGVGQMALYMFVEGIVLFILVLLIEVKFFVGAWLKTRGGTIQSQQQRNEDEDVHNERMRIKDLSHEGIQKESVVLKDLTKVYGGTIVTAVDHLTLGIPRGECFGLLGINGAGKTTTFSMLTGDLSITEGTAFLDGFDIQTNLREVQQRIGYCPQFDALIERLTGREMLTMYAHLRGVPPEKIKDLVSGTIQHLNLTKWADKLCGDYSGGNKRKLSTAIALVGNPPIVFLDEPTTGMDPVARRFLWESLTAVMKGGRSIVLTSHSMEECEALCTRLAIMVNGQFKCLGSTQHLKSRYGTGYTLMVKVASPTPMNPQPVANDFHAAPPSSGPAIPPTAMVYSNPAVNAELPEVNEPAKPLHDGISSQDVQPTVVPNPPHPQMQPPPYSQIQAPPGQLQPLVYDRGLMKAITDAQNFVAQTFPGARLLESHNGVLHFQVETEGLSWSYIFGQLERNRAALHIVDYSVSQTTLEQVFINFAKEQHAEGRTTVKRTCGCMP